VTKSDHRPVTTNNKYLHGVHLTDGLKVHHFEASWLEEEKVEWVVQSTWGRVSVGGGALRNAENNRSAGGTPRLGSTGVERSLSQVG
jgi:hypothetical protein